MVRSGYCHINVHQNEEARNDSCPGLAADCFPENFLIVVTFDPLYFLLDWSQIMNKARKLHDWGEYLLEDVFEQIGYQQENSGLSNSYLAGAYELRSGIPAGETPDSAGPDVIRAMSTELFLNFLGIRMDNRKAEGIRFTINLITPDNGEKLVIELENATLTNIEGFPADDPDLTITINRTDLEQTMMGAKTMDAQIADGTAKIEGDASILKKNLVQPGSTSTHVLRSCLAPRSGIPNWMKPIPMRLFRENRLQNNNGKVG